VYMNILVFNWRDIRHSWAGGSEIYIHELVKRWVKNGNKVILFCAQDREGNLPEKEIIDNVTIYRKGGRYSVYLWAPIWYMTKFRKQSDVIVDVENGIPFFTPLFSRKKKICLVYHVHGKQFFYELSFPLSFIGYVLERYVFPFLYHNIPIMAISESTKRELTRIGFKASKITIVTPGIQKTSFRFQGLLKKYKRPTILYLGRIKRYKRIDILISVLPEILKHHPEARLLIAGWGTEAPVISDLIMKSKHRKHIELIGPVSELEKKTLIHKSWVFVNPSLHEGWGISVIEANLFATPAVAFQVPGLSDAIKNKKSGFLCKDKKEFVEKLNLLLTDHKLRNTMSVNAREWAEKFSWDKAAQQSLSFLKSA
jgi:glycosyltransferase involved in cell wall biosynthesis